MPEAKPRYVSTEQRPRYTRGVLIADMTTPATTWRVGHKVLAGAPVLVMWAPNRATARVFEVVSWGNRPLFSVPLANLKDYVRSTI